MEALLAAHQPRRDERRVWVTLTFAQSSDGKIAGPGKTPLRLSGAESMLMTHRLRALHEGILVGIGTVLVDNPRLDVRLDAYHGPSPRPIVLDRHLRMPVTCRLLQRDPPARPLVLCAEPTASRDAWEARRRALEAAGAHVRAVDVEGPHLAWPSILSILAQERIRSVMIEGGASVIDSVLSSHVAVHKVVVTVSPSHVGEAGYGYAASALWNAPQLHQVATLRLGPDTIVVWDTTA